MKKLVFLHDVSPEDEIDDLVEMTMKAIHGDDPWPEEDGVNLDGEGADISPGGDLGDEDTE